jgi:probable phosphoglycerate mutase
MKLYFTRHGESEANTRRIISNRNLPHPLTRNGRQQVEALAKKMAGRSITRIYASPIPRAKETAEILSAALKVPVECADALREPDCGVLEGRGDEEAWAEHNYWKEAWLKGCQLEHGPQGGETCQEVRKRLTDFFEKMIAGYGETDYEFLLVMHGALILFGLPEVLTGMDQRTILDHGLEHTAYLESELQDGKLTSLGWHRSGIALKGE